MMTSVCLGRMCFWFGEFRDVTSRMKERDAPVELRRTSKLSALRWKMVVS